MSRGFRALLGGSGRALPCVSEADQSARGDAPVTGLPSAGALDSGPQTPELLQAAEEPSTLTLGLLPSSELMEVQHFRTIYHMFIAGLCVLIISTLAIDFIDEGR